MNRDYAIFDLDNCISDDGWRHKHIDWFCANLDARYKKYHELSPFDRAANMGRVDAHIQQRHGIIVFTARPVSMHNATMHWLNMFGVQPKALIMRNHGDHTPSVHLKRKMLGMLTLYDVELDRVVHAYDDRQDIVNMYADAGIAASLLKIHNKCATTPPPENTSVTMS